MGHIKHPDTRKRLVGSWQNDGFAVTEFCNSHQWRLQKRVAVYKAAPILPGAHDRGWDSDGHHSVFELDEVPARDSPCDSRSVIDGIEKAQRSLSTFLRDVRHVYEPPVRSFEVTSARGGVDAGKKLGEPTVSSKVGKGIEREYDITCVDHDILDDVVSQSRERGHCGSLRSKRLGSRLDDPKRARQDWGHSAKRHGPLGVVVTDPYRLKKLIKI
jgi:hypothetical protein